MDQETLLQRLQSTMKSVRAQGKSLRGGRCAGTGEVISSAEMLERPSGSVPYTVEYSLLTEPRVLVVRTSGELPTSSWASISKAATDEGTKRSCHDFLFDHRAARFRVRFADLWALPRNAGAFQLPDGARVALLLKPPLGRERDFIEAFNRNRGFDLKVFDEESSALSWLRQGRGRNPLVFP